MAILQFFPPEFIELQEELTRHPELQKQLNENNWDINGDFVTLFTIITRYVGIDMVGDFTEADIVIICRHVLDKLRAKRVAIIVP